MIALSFGLPSDPRWANFADAWRLTNYPRAALNSAVITVGAVALTLVTNAMVAYAIARNLHRTGFKLVVYVFSQRWVISGVMRGSVK